MTYKEYEQAIRTLHAAAVGLISPNAARATVGLNPVTPPKLTPLICECCGGQIDRETMTCKSCGTAYGYKVHSIYKTEDTEFLPETQWEKENPVIKEPKRCKQ